MYKIVIHRWVIYNELFNIHKTPCLFISRKAWGRESCLIKKVTIHRSVQARIRVVKGEPKVHKRLMVWNNSPIQQRTSHCYPSLSGIQFVRGHHYPHLFVSHLSSFHVHFLDSPHLSISGVQRLRHLQRRTCIFPPQFSPLPSPPTLPPPYWNFQAFQILTWNRQHSEGLKFSFLQFSLSLQLCNIILRSVTIYIWYVSLHLCLPARETWAEVGADVGNPIIIGKNFICRLQKWTETLDVHMQVHGLWISILML